MVATKSGAALGLSFPLNSSTALLFPQNPSPAWDRLCKSSSSRAARRAKDPKWCPLPPNIGVKLPCPVHRQAMSMGWEATLRRGTGLQAPDRAMPHRRACCMHQQAPVERLATAGIKQGLHPQGVPHGGQRADASLPGSARLSDPAVPQAGLGSVRPLAERRRQPVAGQPLCRRQWGGEKGARSLLPGTARNVHRRLQHPAKRAREAAHSSSIAAARQRWVHLQRGREGGRQLQSQKRGREGANSGSDRQVGAPEPLRCGGERGVPSRLQRAGARPCPLHLTHILGRVSWCGAAAAGRC